MMYLNKNINNKNMPREDRFRFGFYGFIAGLLLCAVLLCVISAETEKVYDAELAEKNSVIEQKDKELLELIDNNLKLKGDNANLIEANKDLAAEIIWLEAKITNLNNRLEETGNFVYDYSKLKDHAKDIIALCRVTLGEAGCCSDIQKAAVVWCVLNRVDASNKTIYEVASDKGQFHGYNEKWVVREEELMIVLDILCRWQNEKYTGVTDPGRVLPKNYLYFASGGRDKDGMLINVFRDSYDFKTANYWNFDCTNPYS